jgi:hypothetical protein
MDNFVVKYVKELQLGTKQFYLILGSCALLGVTVLITWIKRRKVVIKQRESISKGSEQEENEDEITEFVATVIDLSREGIFIGY